jgi:hypothetical protein
MSFPFNWLFSFPLHLPHYLWKEPTDSPFFICVYISSFSIDVLFFASSLTAIAFHKTACPLPPRIIILREHNIHVFMWYAAPGTQVATFGFCTSSKVHYARLTVFIFVWFSRAAKPDLSVVTTSRDVASGRWSAGWFWRELSLLWVTSIIWLLFSGKNKPIQQHHIQMADHYVE